MKQYGISEIKSLQSDIERHVENIRLKGFTIIRAVLSLDECKQLCEKAENIYQLQIEEFGEENLRLISELNVVRAPLYYDTEFLKLISNKTVLTILEKIFKNQFILHLQNIIINRPNEEHHQTSWHRDIPYQEYIVSNPIAINVFYCLSPFNQKTGATKILPYSHLKPDFPSIQFAEENSIYVEAEPGDVIIFDSWLYHRASYNSSDIIRYGLNHVYTVPIIKQQIDLPKLMGDRFSEDPVWENLLGYKFQVPNSVTDFRNKRLKKIQK